MPWPESLRPVRMERIALVAPAERARDVLARVASAGVVELDAAGDDGSSGPARQRLDSLNAGAGVVPRVSATEPDLDRLTASGRADLLAGEAELERAAAGAVRDGQVVGIVGWTPATQVPRLRRALADAGGAVARLPRPRGSIPPTLLAQHVAGRAFDPLVGTYATVPYADVDPSLLAGLSYVVMFGMMFGDAGQGLVLVLAGLLLRTGRVGRLAPIRRLWLFVVGCGLTSVVFGILFGEFFGPTGVLPVVWLSPLDEPVTLLAAGLCVGALLLAGAYALGSVNRVREGGWGYALYARSGIAGSVLFLALAMVVGGAFWSRSLLAWSGLAAAVVGVGLAFVGLLAAAGGGGAGIVQALVETFDFVIRLGTNVLSFARLAAFGLTHAALGAIVWTATTALWDRPWLGAIAAVIVFVIGNAFTFSLEALVSGIQALRLEYYELFSRVFETEGRPFRPWHVAAEPAPGSSIDREAFR
jgi:V/A-type H+/Na+-transporting ATPase subunit I